MLSEATPVQKSRYLSSGTVVRGLRRLGQALVGLLALSLTVWLFLGPVFIPSESMAPTLEPGDVVLVNRLAYDAGPLWRVGVRFQWAKPARGDIVIFRAPPALQGRYKGYVIKRVVAVAGTSWRWSKIKSCSTARR